MTPDAARLASIRARYAAIAPGRHQLVYDGEGALIVADGPRGEKFEIARILSIASNDERDFLGEAADSVRFLLDLVDRAARKVRELSSSASRAEGAPAGRATTPGGQSASRPAADLPNYAAEAAIKCGEAAFKAFLEQCHGLERPLSDERVAQKVRSLLGVVSRADLNKSSESAARWKDLRAAYEAWKRAER